MYAGRLMTTLNQGTESRYRVRFLRGPFSETFGLILTNRECHNLSDPTSCTDLRLKGVQIIYSPLDNVLPNDLFTNKVQHATNSQRTGQLVY